VFVPGMNVSAYAEAGRVAVDFLQEGHDAVFRQIEDPRCGLLLYRKGRRVFFVPRGTQRMVFVRYSE